MAASGPTRVALISAAASEFAKVGFHGAKIATICKKAGLANGTFYIYFRDKEALLRAVIAQGGAELGARLREAVRDGLTPREQDRLDTEIIVRFTSEFADTYRSMLLSRGPDPANRNLIVQSLAGQREAMLESWAREGKVSLPASARSIALAESGIMAAMIQAWQSDPDGRTLADLTDEICRVRARILFGD